MFDPVSLAKIQFFITIGFHFIFPPLSIGLSWYIVYWLTRYMKTKDEKYYVDREDLKDGWEKHPQIDINGNKVYTNYMLMSLKFVLEDLLGKLSGAGWFFNCTEAGIFGVSKKHGNLPWIHQLKLKTGIAQARQIMRTGEPFYL